MFKIKNISSKLTSLLITVMVLTSLSSCASIAGDNMRTVCINSHPQGAGVYVDGQRRGTTPVNITLPTYIYGGKTLTFKKEGYYDQAMVLNTKFQPCGLLNIFFW